MFIKQIRHCTVYLDTRYMDCFGWMKWCFITCFQRCLYTQSRRYKQLGAYNRRVLLLHGGGGGGGGGGGVTAVWAVLLTFVFWNFNIFIGLLILMMKVRASTTWSVCCAHTVVAFNKHREDGALVLKHSSWYVMWNVVCDWFYCFWLVDFVD